MRVYIEVDKEEDHNAENPIEEACNIKAYARRKWLEAIADGATLKTSKAVAGYQYCNKLFTLEKKCADQKVKYRRE